jgi:hypothetical protein
MLGGQLRQRGLQLVAGLLAELDQANVPDLIIAEGKFLLAIDILDHVNVNDGAGELVILHLA